MNDADGPTIARHVYGQLFRGNGEYLDPDDIAYGLDDAVQEMRKTHISASRWSLFIHLGI